MEKACDKKRNSNFELLRIFAILAIILSHFNYHGDIRTIIPESLSINFVFNKFFQMGSIGNHIFIIITGYFLVNKKINYKRIIKLILQMYFYSISIFIVLYATNLEKYSITDLVKVLFPVAFGNWFIIYYCLLYLIMPYLNRLIRKINQKEFVKLIILLIMIIYTIPTFTANSWGYSRHDYFIVDYLIGAFLGLYPTKFFNENKNCFKILTISLFSVIVSIIISSYIGMKFSIDKLVISSGYLISNNYSILGLFIAISIFCVFKNLKPKDNLLINKTAHHTLGVYLIHENFKLKSIIWTRIFPNTELYNNSLFIIFALCKVLAVFIICLLIDKVRSILFENLENKISDLIYKYILGLKNFFKAIKRKGEQL